MKHSVDPRVVCCAIWAAVLIAGCDESSSKNASAPAPQNECSTNQDCANREDGKIECTGGACVKPASTDPKCGDGEIGGSEACDGSNLAGKTAQIGRILSAAHWSATARVSLIRVAVSSVQMITRPNVAKIKNVKMADA